MSVGTVGQSIIPIELATCQPPPMAQKQRIRFRAMLLPTAFASCWCGLRKFTAVNIWLMKLPVSAAPGAGNPLDTV